MNLRTTWDKNRSGEGAKKRLAHGVLNAPLAHRNYTPVTAVIRPLLTASASAA
jgi:hypothetical protein